MEEVSATLVGRAGLAEPNQQTQGIRSAPKQTTPTKHLIRRRSVFSLASDLFRAHEAGNDEGCPPELHNQRQKKGSWNPFASLRGSRENQYKTIQFATACCKSSSPEKGDTLVINEFGGRKITRRKSLQDLLGTVSDRFSMRHRHMVGKDILPLYESLSTEPMQAHCVSPLVLPDAALDMPSPPDAVCGSLNMVESQDLFFRTEHDKHDGSPLGLEHNSIDQTPVRHGQLLKTLSCSIKHANEKTNPVQRISIRDLYLLDSTETAQPPSFLEESNSSGLRQRSHNLKLVSPSPSPDKICPTMPIDFLRDVSPEVPMHVRFSDKKIPPQYRYSETFGGTTTSPEIVGLHSSFPSRALDREERYKSICSSPHNKSSKRTSQEIEGQIALTADHMSENLHLSTTQSRWSVDSSETDTEDMSTANYKRPVTPVYQTPKSEAGFTTTALTLMNASTSEDIASGLSSTARLSTAEDGLGGYSGLEALMSMDEARQETKPMLTLKTDERFGSRPVNRRNSSEDPVHVKFPESEFQEAYTKTYASKSDAIEDLYHNRAGYSDYYLFHRDARTIHPQILGKDLALDSMWSDDKGLELLWLPMSFFPAAPSSSDGADRADEKPNVFSKRFFNLGAASQSKPLGASTSDSEFQQALDIQNPDVAGSLGQDSLRWNYKINNDAISENGYPTGYDESCPSRPQCPNTSVSEVSGSRVGSSALGDLSESDEMDDSYEVAIDSATARLYLGSLFSSTESLRSDKRGEVIRPNSTNSFWSRVEDARLEEAKYVKTWAELGKDFLERYAPDNQMNPSQRAEMAVREALRKRRTYLEPSENCEIHGWDALKTACNDHYNIQAQEWTRDRDYSDDIAFEHIEDIAKYESAREGFTKAAKLSHTRDDTPQIPVADSSTRVDAKGKGKEVIELNECFVSSSVESEKRREQPGQMIAKQQAANPDVQSNGYRSTSQKFEQDGVELRESDTMTARTEQVYFGSGESHSSSNTVVTIPSVYKSAQPLEHPGEATGETRIEVSTPSESDSNEATRVLVVPPDLDFDLISMNGVAGGNNSASSPYEDSASRDVPIKQKDIGSPLSTTDNICPPQHDRDLTPMRYRSPTLSNSDLTSAEALSGPTLQRARVSTAPGIIKRFSSSSVITTPYSGRKRVLTPNMRPASPLTELFSLSSPRMQAPAPPASEAGTEVSECFGQKLQRYGRAEEDAKENSGQWYRGSLLDG